jgi:hypothetical protein
MLDLKISISITTTALKFLKILSAKLKFCMKKLLCTSKTIQEVSDFSLPYNRSVLKKCTRFTEGITETRHPSKYRIILFENVRN